MTDERDCFTDIGGVRVGHAHDAAARTGVTVIFPDAPVTMAVAPGRRVWVQTVRGTATVNGVALTVGDAAAITGETALTCVGEAELLVFDMG